MGGSAVWLVSPDLPGETNFVVKAWAVRYYDQATYLLSSSDSGFSDFASPWAFLPKAGAFPRSGCDARLELTASNARRGFGLVFSCMDYQLMHQAGSDPLRVAPDASLHQRADLETLPMMPQLMRDLEFPHDLPVVAALIVSYFRSTSGMCKETRGPSKNRCSSRSGSSASRTRTSAKLCLQRSWLLPSVTAFAAEEHLPRFPTRTLAFGNIKAFPNASCQGRVSWLSYDVPQRNRLSEELQGCRSPQA